MAAEAFGDGERIDSVHQATRRRRSPTIPWSPKHHERFFGSEPRRRAERVRSEMRKQGEKHGEIEDDGKVATNDNVL